MKLQILIPTLVKRQHMFQELIDELSNQITKYNLQEEVGIARFMDNGEAHIGYKRNALVENSPAEYICFLDDDDWVDRDYVYLQHYGASQDMDCSELRGIYTQDGNFPTPFIHSVKYNKYFSKSGCFYRPPNHLNVIKRELILPFKFPETSFGEDTNWAMRVCQAGVLKTEVKIQKPIDGYRYVSKPRRLK
jgi:glycosyltransferase involved in cell wall biosynthesis